MPARLQSIAELSYEFVADMVRSTAGAEGMKFFPFVFSLFMFILIANMIGMIPYTFTVTSHIIVTVALAILVFLTVLVYGLYRNGLHFLKLFVPNGVPIYILPLVVVIEILSFLSRPISHSVRLFANMLAGHITLKVFAGFVASLGGAWARSAGPVGVLPLAMIVALTALEILVAFLQAYVFAILTCIYLNDAFIRATEARTAVPDKRSLSWIQSQRSIIGAGIACIGMGGAGVGVGTIFGNYLAARAAQSVRRAGPVRQPDLRLRGDRSARHLLAADRAPAAVRGLTKPRRGAGASRWPSRAHQGEHASTPAQDGPAAAFRRSTRAPSPRSSSGSRSPSSCSTC